MSKKTVVVWLAFAMSLMARAASAQVYIPIASENPVPSRVAPSLKSDELTTTLMEGATLATEVSNKSLTAAVVPATLPACNPEPALAAIQGSLEYHQTLMSRAAAVKLGLPFASGSGSQNQMILVRDWTRGVECAATDGKTRLLYGQTIRTVIAIEVLDAKTDLSLAALAANATINRKNSQVSITSIGFVNPKINEAIAGIAGKELNVETYADFTRVESALISLADTRETTQSVRRLGVVTDLTENSLRDSVATAFALYQMKDGKSCDQASRGSDLPNSHGRLHCHTAATNAEATRRADAVRPAGNKVVPGRGDRNPRGRCTATLKCVRPQFPLVRSTGHNAIYVFTLL